MSLTPWGFTTKRSWTLAFLAGGDGLSDPNEGAVVEFTGDAPTIRLGAYGSVSERFSGYWGLNVASLDEATMWAARCPMVPGSSLEVRRITDESDFAEFEGNEYLEKEKTWREILQETASSCLPASELSLVAFAEVPGEPVVALRGVFVEANDRDCFAPPLVFGGDGVKSGHGGRVPNVGT